MTVKTARGVGPPSTKSPLRSGGARPATRTSRILPQSLPQRFGLGSLGKTPSAPIGSCHQNNDDQSVSSNIHRVLDASSNTATTAASTMSSSSSRRRRGTAGSVAITASAMSSASGSRWGAQRWARSRSRSRGLSPDSSDSDNEIKRDDSNKSVPQLQRQLPELGRTTTAPIRSRVPLRRTKSGDDTSTLAFSLQSLPSRLGASAAPKKGSMAASWHGLEDEDNIPQERELRRGRRPRQLQHQEEPLGNDGSGGSGATRGSSGEQETAISSPNNRPTRVPRVERTRSAPLHNLAEAVRKNQTAMNEAGAKLATVIAGPILKRPKTLAQRTKSAPLEDDGNADLLSEAFSEEFDTFPALVDFHCSQSVMSPDLNLPVTTSPSPSTTKSGGLGRALFGIGGGQSTEKLPGLKRTASAPLNQLARAANNFGLLRTNTPKSAITKVEAATLATQSTGESRKNSQISETLRIPSLGRASSTPMGIFDEEDNETLLQTPVLANFKTSEHISLPSLDRASSAPMNMFDEAEEDEALEIPVLGRASSAPFDMFDEEEESLHMRMLPSRNDNHVTAAARRASDASNEPNAPKPSTITQKEDRVADTLDGDSAFEFPSTCFDPDSCDWATGNTNHNENDGGKNDANNTSQRKSWHHAAILPTTDKSFDTASEDYDGLDKHNTSHGYSFEATYNAEPSEHKRGDSEDDNEGCTQVTGPRARRIRERAGRSKSPCGRRALADHQDSTRRKTPVQMTFSEGITAATTEKKETALDIRRKEEIAKEFSSSESESDDEFAIDVNMSAALCDYSSSDQRTTVCASEILRQIEENKRKKLGKTRHRKVVGKCEKPEHSKEPHKHKEDDACTGSQDSTSVTATSESSLLSAENDKASENKGKVPSKRDDRWATAMHFQSVEVDDDSGNCSSGRIADNSKRVDSEGDFRIEKHRKKGETSGLQGKAIHKKKAPKEKAKDKYHAPEAQATIDPISTRSTAVEKKSTRRKSSSRQSRKKKPARDSDCSLSLSDLRLSSHSKMSDSEAESHSSKRMGSSRPLSMSDPGKSTRRDTKKKPPSHPSLQLDTVLENQSEDASKSTSKRRTSHKERDQLSVGDRSVSSSSFTTHTTTGSPEQHSRRSIGPIHSTDTEDMKKKKILSNTDHRQRKERRGGLAGDDNDIRPHSMSTLRKEKKIENVRGGYRASDHNLPNARHIGEMSLPHDSNRSSLENLSDLVEHGTGGHAHFDHNPYFGGCRYGQDTRLWESPMYQYNNRFFRDPREINYHVMHGRFMSPSHYHRATGTIYEEADPPDDPYMDPRMYDYGGQPYGQQHYGQHPEYYPPDNPYTNPRMPERERRIASMEMHQIQRGPPWSNQVDHEKARHDPSQHSTIDSQVGDDSRRSTRSVQRRHSIGSGHTRGSIMQEVTAAIEQESRFNICNHCGQSVSRCRCNVFHNNMDPLIDMSHHARAHARRPGIPRDTRSRLTKSGSGAQSSLFDTFGIDGNSHHIPHRQGVSHRTIDKEVHSSFDRPLHHSGYDYHNSYQASALPMYGRPSGDDVNEYVHMNNTQRLSGSISTNSHRGRTFQHYANTHERANESHHRRRGFGSRNAPEDYRRAVDDGSLRYPPRQFDRGGGSNSGRRSIFDDSSYRSFAI